MLGEYMFNQLFEAIIIRKLCVLSTDTFFFLDYFQSTLVGSAHGELVATEC